MFLQCGGGVCRESLPCDFLHLIRCGGICESDYWPCCNYVFLLSVCRMETDLGMAGVDPHREEGVCYGNGTVLPTEVDATRVQTPIVPNPKLVSSHSYV